MFFFFSQIKMYFSLFGKLEKKKRLKRGERELKIE
jgi:hypothetical protein